MADDTPDTPAQPAAEPTPRRRAAPRTGSGKTAAKATTARKPKGAVARAEEAVGRTANTIKEAVVDAEQRAVRAVKPRSTTRASARPEARGTRSTTAKESTRTTPAAKTARKTAGTRGSAKNKSAIAKATDKVGGWRVAALAGVAAAGATAAAVLTLRGSSTRPPVPPKNPAGAHQPDGTDSSASFRAGIADENTVPDKV